MRPSNTPAPRWEEMLVASDGAPFSRSTISPLCQQCAFAAVIGSPYAHASRREMAPQVPLASMNLSRRAGRSTHKRQRTRALPTTPLADWTSLTQCRKNPPARPLTGHGPPRARKSQHDVQLALSVPLSLQAPPLPNFTVDPVRESIKHRPASAPTRRGHGVKERYQANDVH